VDGAIAEYREALHLNPRLADARVRPGGLLLQKSDYDGSVAESRKATDLRPNLAAGTQ
jgi:hypothetical protein